MAKKVNLLQVTITDYKGIKSLNQEIDGKHFIAFGKNGAGKTSLFEVINRLATRIDPKDMADIQIRHGAKSARFSCIYGVTENGTTRKILVESNVTPKSGKTLSVMDMDSGENLKPAIERLQGIIGENHDVTPLMDMSGSDQFKYLLKMLGGNSVLQQVELDYKRKYSQRRSLSTNIKSLDIKLQASPITHEMIMDSRVKGTWTENKPMPEKPTNSIELERITAQGKNEQIQRARYARVDIQNTIDELKAKLETAQARLEEANKWLSDNPVIDMSVFESKEIEFMSVVNLYDEEVIEVQEYNKTVNEMANYKRLETELLEFNKQKKQLEKDMDDDKKKMANVLSELKLEDIVPELEIKNEYDEDTEEFTKGIFYGDLPFNRRQISYGKMLVALAKLSAFINADKLNFFHIPAWESLDDESRKDILDFAKNNPELNVQFGIEEVTKGYLGVKLIEDTRFIQPDAIK